MGRGHAARFPRHGSYRAALTERLRLAREYGEARCYWLPVTAAQY